MSSVESCVLCAVAGTMQACFAPGMQAGKCRFVARHVCSVCVAGMVCWCNPEGWHAHGLRSPLALQENAGRSMPPDTLHKTEFCLQYGLSDAVHSSHT